MDGIENNNLLPFAAGESQFLRDLPCKLYRVGLATFFTGAGGLLEQLLAAGASARSSSRQQAEAEDVPPPLLSQSQLRLFLLLAALFGGLCAIYTARRVELEHAAAPTPRWRKAGVVVYFLCLLLLITSVSLVGSSGYCDLALNFIDD